MLILVIVLVLVDKNMLFFFCRCVVSAITTIHGHTSLCIVVKCKRVHKSAASNNYWY